MQVLRAKRDEAATLTAIALAAKRHWRYPESWIEHWRELLTITPEFIDAHEAYAAVVEGRPIGFYALASQGGRQNLLHLWVLPKAMGNGVGRCLFLHALERTKALGFRQLHVESDPNAEGFYRRLGARRVGTRITEVEHQQRELPILVYEIAG